jgi:hypothetical protein
MYSITSQAYTDPYFNYKNILTINKIPTGTLANYTKKINISPQRISAFRTRAEETTCVYAIYNTTTNELLTIDELPEFFSFCKINGYKIETEITQMLSNNQLQMKNIICYISNV